MTKWSKAQDDILREFGNHGAEYCARLIRERFGIERTAQAVSRHAYRIHVSIVRYETCPQCGRRVARLAVSGVCPICHQRELAADQRRFNERLLAEINGSEYTEEFAEARKDYQAARQQTSRLCRKHGVPNRKERRYGESAKCRDEMSKARPGAEK